MIPKLKTNNGNISRKETDMKDIKRELETIQKIEANGAYLRSKIEFIENNENNTKYFLNKEKQNHDQKNITKLESKNGPEITDPKEVLNETAAFYEGLYKKADNISCDYYNCFYR